MLKYSDVFYAFPVFFHSLSVSKKGIVFLFRHQMSSIKMSFGSLTSISCHFLEKAVLEKFVFFCQCR